MDHIQARNFTKVLTSLIMQKGMMSLFLRDCESLLPGISTGTIQKEMKAASEENLLYVKIADVI